MAQGKIPGGSGGRLAMDDFQMKGCIVENENNGIDLDKNVTDAELRDPEYMRAYVGELQATIGDLARRAQASAPYDFGEYQPGQWWLEKLENLWGHGAVDDDTRRAAKVACDFARLVFEQRASASPVAEWVNREQGFQYLVEPPLPDGTKLYTASASPSSTDAAAKSEQAPTSWATGSGAGCANCGQALIHHEHQIYCPEASAAGAGAGSAQDARALYEAWELAEAERRKGEPLDADEIAYVLKRWPRQPDTYNICPHHWPAFQAGHRAVLEAKAEQLMAGAAAKSEQGLPNLAIHVNGVWYLPHSRSSASAAGTGSAQQDVEDGDGPAVWDSKKGVWKRAAQQAAPEAPMVPAIVRLKAECAEATRALKPYEDMHESAATASTAAAPISEQALNIGGCPFCGKSGACAESCPAATTASASIGDDPEFDRLRAAYVKALDGDLNTYAAAKREFIAYIDNYRAPSRAADGQQGASRPDDKGENGNG